MQDRYVIASMVTALGMFAWLGLGLLFRRPRKNELFSYFVYNNVFVATEAGILFLAAAWIAEIGGSYHSKAVIRAIALIIPPVVTVIRLLWQYRAMIHLRLTSR